ncbi:MAG: hypothetical protein D6806_00770, partial [Deltaproteobacteria bacterium]
KLGKDEGEQPAGPPGEKLGKDDDVTGAGGAPVGGKLGKDEPESPAPQAGPGEKLGGDEK